MKKFFVALTITVSTMLGAASAQADNPWTAQAVQAFDNEFNRCAEEKDLSSAAENGYILRARNDDLQTFKICKSRAARAALKAQRSRRQARR